MIKEKITSLLHKIGDAAKKVGAAIKKGFDAVKEKVAPLCHKIGDAAKKAGAAIKKGYDTVSEKIMSLFHKDGEVRKTKHASLDKRKARSGYIFVLPFLIGIVAIYIPMLIDSILFSLNAFDYQHLREGSLPSLKWNGIEFYKDAFQNQDFTAALWESLQDLLFQVPAILIFSLFIAVVLNQKMLGRAVFRAIYFVPVIIATGLMDSINAQDVMTALMEGTGGASATASSSGSELLSAMDLMTLVDTLPLGSELVSFVVRLINSVFDIVNYSGVQMLIFLAGLQSISPAIYEACQIEGATAWETFWKITFPMISPMILVNAFYTIIDSFTRNNSAVMRFIYTSQKVVDYNLQTAMSWIFFLIVFLILAVIGGIMSTFIFYQRRD